MLSWLWAGLRSLLRRPLVAVSLIATLPNGELVLIQRADDGGWSLPGGLIDRGETVEQAAARELQEETGLHLVRIDRCVGIYSAPDRDPRIHAICIALAVTVAGDLRVGDRHEVQAIASFPPDQLPAGPYSHDHQRQLQDYRSGAVVIA